MVMALVGGLLVDEQNGVAFFEAEAAGQQLTHRANVVFAACEIWQKRPGMAILVNRNMQGSAHAARGRDARWSHDYLLEK